MLTWFTLLLFYLRPSLSFWNRSDARARVDAAKVDLKDFLPRDMIKWLPGDGTFLTGKVHHDWVINSEKKVLSSIASGLLSAKVEHGRCVLIDCGMNDGFYTMLGGYLGCKVHSFEIQDACIYFAKEVITRNIAGSYGNFSDIEIHRAPLSNVSNEQITLSFPESRLCDGGFTITGSVQSRIGRTHANVPLTREERYTSQTLDSIFFSMDNFTRYKGDIDVVKIDVEGHESEVIEGASLLLQSHRIKKILFEVQVLDDSQKPYGWTNPKYSLGVIKKLFGYGYEGSFLQSCGSLGPHVVFDKSNFRQFKSAVFNKNRGYDCVDIEMVLITITETTNS
jgi:FkbM family methyltransferase